MSDVDELDLIDELIVQGENQTVDFKISEILSNPIKLATLMVAFANSSGGRILIGVCDDGTLEGMKTKKEHETHIMNIARDKCDPPLIPKFSVIRKSQGDIYVVKVLRYQMFPHAIKTKDGRVYFVRVGSTVREASSSELALLFEAIRERIVSKKPELELLLVDDSGNATKEIHAQPTIVKKKIIKKPRETLLPRLAAIAELSRQTRILGGLGIFGSKEPAKDLVPIGIQISNVGEMPVQGIRVFLKFPDDCELVEENDAVGSLRYLIQSPSAGHGGLFIDEENEREASAWVDILGNDLTMKHFRKVYVRFPEKEQEYKVEAQITQHGFSPKDFEFLISVKPRIVEVIEDIYEEESG